AKTADVGTAVERGSTPPLVGLSIVGRLPAIIAFTRSKITRHLVNTPRCSLALSVDPPAPRHPAPHFDCPGGDHEDPQSNKIVLGGGSRQLWLTVRRPAGSPAPVTTCEPDPDHKTHATAMIP